MDIQLENVVLHTEKPVSLSGSTALLPIRRLAKTTPVQIWNSPSVSDGAGVRPQGKKAYLKFTQHMFAVCKPGGMVVTVMPHGVLFRGGAEKEIRRKFLEEDLIEAIIGLPPNLFYGAGIPACILVLRPNLTPAITQPQQAPGTPRPRLSGRPLPDG